jgi:hypothetical protein
MAIELIKYPVTFADGIVNNVFAGFQPLEIEFVREDLAIVSVGDSGGSLLVTVAGDLSALLNVGEWLYLYAEAVGFNYDNSFQISNITYAAPNTLITLNTAYIANSSTGYINYKQNYFVEAKLVNVDNNAILIYPDTLDDDGTPAGDITINISSPVDYLSNEILTSSGEVSNSRVRFSVMVREVWRENQTNSFVLIDSTFDNLLPDSTVLNVPIIVTYAADSQTPEKFVNDFDMPRMWEGYPFSLAILHSIDNFEGEKIAVTFDELDINQDVISTENPLFEFEPTAFGFLQVNFSDNTNTIADNTRYLNFTFGNTAAADYETVDYDDTDYLTINTP